MRNVMMPKRQRPRAEDTASRLASERQRNAERLALEGERPALERLRAAQRNAGDGEPPPF
jgi:hypothetical protein